MVAQDKPPGMRSTLGRGAHARMAHCRCRRLSAARLQPVTIAPEGPGPMPHRPASATAGAPPSALSHRSTARARAPRCTRTALAGWWRSCHGRLGACEGRQAARLQCEMAEAAASRVPPSQWHSLTSCKSLVCLPRDHPDLFNATLTHNVTEYGGALP